MTDIAKSSLIRFDLPFMINLPDGEYTVNLDNVAALVLLTREKVSESIGIPQDVVFPPDSYVMGDRWGKFQYSKVVVRVKHPIYIKVHALLPDYLLEISTKVINRILDVCRGVKGDHYSRIIFTDIFSYYVEYIDTNNNLQSFSFGTINSNIVSMGGAEIPTQDQILSIRNVLEKNAQLPIFQELLFDAYDHHFYGNYKTAVIDASTAFEVFIEKFISEGYKKIGKNEQYIQNILGAGLKNLLQSHIKKLTNHDFSCNPLYSQWNKLAYEMRNDVVHRGKNISADTSRIAIETTLNTICFLQSL